MECEGDNINIYYFKGLLRQFEEAAIIHSKSGGGHPADIPHKKEHYLDTHKVIISYVEYLTERIDEEK